MEESKDTQQDVDSTRQSRRPDSDTYLNNNESNDLVELIEALRAVDIDAPLAQLNATTISDNNGGRIEL